MALLALAFPFPALPDMTGTLALTTTVSLDAGATPGCAGDLSFGGNSIFLTPSPTYSAGIYLIPGTGGVDEFNSLTAATLQNLAYAPSGSAPATVGTVFAVRTNGGHYAKVLVTAASSNSVTLQYTTYGVTAGTPVVIQVQNNYSYLGVAPGSLFIIVGCGLAAPGSQAVLQDSTKGLPLTLNGASISVTSGAVTMQPAIYYASPTQIAAVMPSGTVPGAASVTVTYNGQTNTPEPMFVAWSSFGFAGTATGVGPAIVTDSNYQLVTPTHSASPGQVITFWGTGLGAGPADSDVTYTPTPHGISVAELPLEVLIGGVIAPIQYQGRNGYPGLDQINVTVPQGVPTGCAVSVVAINSNYQIISNSVTLPVASDGGTCIDPLFAISPEQIASLSAKSTVNVGVLSLEQNTGLALANLAMAQANFLTVPGSSLAQQATGTWAPVSLGSCIVGWPANSLPDTSGLSWLEYPGLDAGAMTFTGPGGMQTMTESTSPLITAYAVELPQGAFPGGSGAFSAAGGKDVGAFSANLSFPLQEQFTNIQVGFPATAIGRGGYTLTWTGGSEDEFVTISGSNGYASFACNAPANTGQFLIPSYALVPLAGGNGDLAIGVATYPQPFTAAALDAGYVFGHVVPSSLSGTVIYY